MEILRQEETKIENRQIKCLSGDYTLKLEDLEDLEIKIDNRKVYATFKPIYLYTLEKLIKLDLIHGAFKYYQLNGYYEKQKEKYKGLIHNIEISEDIIDYLFNYEKEYYKKQ